MKRRAPSLLSQLTRYILLFFTITVLFGGILLVQFSRSYRNDLKSMCQSHLESASAVLSRHFSEMQAQTSFLSGHTSVRQLLDSSYLKNAAWVELLRDDVLPVLDQANLGGQGILRCVSCIPRHSCPTCPTPLCAKTPPRLNSPRSWIRCPPWAIP